VLLGYYELPPQRIYAELERRFGLSGLEEKERRNSPPNQGKDKS
jgi:phosphoribosyl-ATP pyrophosphohydrolase/phosphoribosyl-AMP cyclohydrolase